MKSTFDNQNNYMAHPVYILVRPEIKKDLFLDNERFYGQICTKSVEFFKLAFT